MISINQVKLIKKGEALELSYTKTETDGRVLVVNGERGKYSCHEDLIAAFAALAPHVAMLGSYVPFVKNLEAVKLEDYEQYRCTSFSISGEGDGKGVVLTAHKIRWDGKAVGYNCPFDMLEESEDELPDGKKKKPYPYMEELVEAIDLIDTEAREYLNGTKVGPIIEKKSKKKKTQEVDPNQMDLVDEVNKITTAQILPPRGEGEPEGPFFADSIDPDDEDENPDLTVQMENSGDPAFDAADRMRSTAKNKTSIPQADPHAMARVAGTEPLSSPEGVVADIVAKANGGKAETAAQRKRRVAQSAANPSGLVDDDKK